MTPERAQYHLLMLRMGEYDEYDRELDRLLLEQDPLSPLVLELALCMSDRRETISVLRNFLLDHPADERALMESQLEWVRRQYREKAMTATQAAEYLSRVYFTMSGTDPWWELWQYLDDYDLYCDGIISREVFETCFDALLLRGEDLDCWALQNQENQKKSFLDRVRSALKKS